MHQDVSAMQAFVSFCYVSVQEVNPFAKCMDTVKLDIHTCARMIKQKKQKRSS